MRSPHLDEGVRLFNEGDYFMAHEVWEEAWAEMEGDQRDFLQGLIHLSVGLLHAGRGNSKGALLQFQKSEKRLSKLPDSFNGVDLEAVRSFLMSAPNEIGRGVGLKPPVLA